MIDLERLHRHYSDNPPTERKSGRTFAMLCELVLAATFCKPGDAIILVVNNLVVEGTMYARQIMKIAQWFDVPASVCTARLELRIGEAMVQITIWPHGEYVGRGYTLVDVYEDHHAIESQEKAWSQLQYQPRPLVKLLWPGTNHRPVYL